MLSLQLHHIVDLYYWVDEMIPRKEHSIYGGRPPVLANSELVTLLIWNTLVLHQTTIRDLHTHTGIHLTREFPRIPKYNAFLEHCHRATPAMFRLLEYLLSSDEPVKIVDSTMLPVCKLQRADSHKTAKNLAAFGKNHQGWYYGFKLHTAITLNGQLSSVALTPANIYDAQMMPNILNEYTEIAVGDSHYGAKVMQRYIWEKYGCVVITPPHFKQKRKLSAPWQIHLLNQRSKIESVFDILKEHMHLVSSFPRSVFGYLVHYVRILLSYQIMALCGF